MKRIREWIIVSTLTSVVVFWTYFLSLPRLKFVNPEQRESRVAGESGSALYVPYSAVESRNGKDYVYVLDGNCVQEIQVLCSDVLCDTQCAVTQGLTRCGQVVESYSDAASNSRYRR